MKTHSHTMHKAWHFHSRSFDIKLPYMLHSWQPQEHLGIKKKKHRRSVQKPDYCMFETFACLFWVSKFLRTVSNKFFALISFYSLLHSKKPPKNSKPNRDPVHEKDKPTKSCMKPSTENNYSLPFKIRV